MSRHKVNFNFMSRRVLLFLIFLSFSMLLIYTMGFRNDWVFGITDSFTGKREGLELNTIDYNNEDLNIIELEEILNSKSDIKLTNSLVLINKKHRIDENLEFDLVTFRDTSLLVENNIQDDLDALLNANKRNTGEKIFIMSSYRTAEEQEVLFQENPRIAAPVNASEHQTGLALDLYVYQKAQREFIDTAAGKWVHHNGWKYGFIIRYPFLKKYRTGVGYEPWHVRYVGKPHAKIIYMNRWTLEEYIDSLSEDIFYSVDDYVISRQSPRNGKLKIPNNIENIIVSPDNTGFYIITGTISVQ